MGVAGKLNTPSESLRIPVGHLDGNVKRPPVTQRDRGAWGHVIPHSASRHRPISATQCGKCSRSPLPRSVTRIQHRSLVGTATISCMSPRAHHYHMGAILTSRHHRKLNRILAAR